MPFYKREKFLPIIKHNINKQTYPKELLTLIMDDDSNKKLSADIIKNLKDSISPVKLIYLSSQRKTIGKKRNDICRYIYKLNKNGIVAHMDTDDLYNKDYIKKGVDMIKNNKYKIIGSSEMLFTYPYHDYNMAFMRCNKKQLIHEASMIYTIKMWKSSQQFNNGMTGEGVQFLNGISDSLIYDCPIQDCLVCISHKENTINKEQFYIDKLKIPYKIDNYDKQIISECL